MKYNKEEVQTRLIEMETSHILHELVKLGRAEGLTKDFYEQIEIHEIIEMVKKELLLRLK